jgi:hypothetical protein
MEVARPAGEAVNQNAGMSLPSVQTTANPMTMQQPVAQPVQAQVATTTGPTIASDVDVIEKEWVNKAKIIVNQTRQDPYMQEKQVSELQADYLKKRYGKDVKQAGN